MAKEVDTVNQMRTSVPAGEDVIEAMHQVMHLYRTVQYRASEAGLVPMDGKVLRFFARHPGATLKELSADFERDKGQLGKVIGSLKERGLLEAEPDEVDRRSMRLRLTAGGRRVQQALRRRTHKLAERAMAQLGGEERRLLLALLGRVASNLQAAP